MNQPAAGEPIVIDGLGEEAGVRFEDLFHRLEAPARNILARLIPRLAELDFRGQEAAAISLLDEIEAILNGEHADC